MNKITQKELKQMTELDLINIKKYDNGDPITWYTMPEFKSLWESEEDFNDSVNGTGFNKSDKFARYNETTESYESTNDFETVMKEIF